MDVTSNNGSKLLTAIRRCLNIISCKNVDVETMDKELREISEILNTGPIPSTYHANLENLMEYFIVNADKDWVQKSLDEMIIENESRLKNFFSNCPPKSSLFVLISALIKLNIGVRQQLCLRLLEEFFKNGRITILLLEESTRDSDDIDLYKQTVSYNLLSFLNTLPDRIANKTRGKFSDIFHHKQFFQLLAIHTSDVISTLVKNVRKDKNIYVKFLAQMFGQLCFSGKSDDFLGTLLPLFTVHAKSDFVWRRIIQKILSSIPERYMEATVLYIVKNIPWYGCAKWMFGDMIQQNRKLKFLFLHKFILLKHFNDESILKNIIGCIADSETTQHLVIETLQELLSVWSDSSAIKHVSYEQHKYITQAILICIGHLTKQQTEESQHNLTMWMAPGMSSHLDSTDSKIRRLGMIVGEVISEKANIKGTNKLDFGYEKDEETRDLFSLITPDPSPDDDYYQNLLKRIKTTRESVLGALNKPSTIAGSVETFTTSKSTFLKVISGSMLEKEIAESKNVHSEENNIADDASDSDSDDDDDLQPYDLSNDTVYKKVITPMYIRDCMEGILQHENREQMEICLGCIKKLINEDPVSTKEVSVELCRILLDLQDTFALDNFALLRISSMSALTVVDPVNVARYLTHEFYAENYSLQHRLDILDVLTSAAGVLSSVERKDENVKERKPIATNSNPGSVAGSEGSWREIVDRRIESKTRRFGKGKKKLSIPKENNFGQVAGCFFYPLLSGYDRRIRTMDLLGTDSIVLGRLLYSVGTIVYSAMNTMAVNAMATSLLDFTIEVRFHSEAYVRQAALFCVSMAILSTGKSLIKLEIISEITDWIHETMSKDPNAKTRELAAQTAFMIKTHFSKELGMES